MPVELNPITSGYSTGLINDNFQIVEDELNNNVLRRDGLSSGEANQMEVGLDMNSNFIYNLPEPVLEHQAARLQDVQNAIAGADSANLISFTPYGDITSENVQGAVQELVDALEERSEVQTSNVVFNIPTDYPSLQEAIDDLSSRTVVQGFSITLNIETGHSLASGISVANGDYSKFIITSTDAEVTLSASFPDDSQVLFCDNARAPVIDVLFNATGSEASRGLVYINTSSGIVLPGAGVKNISYTIESSVPAAGVGLFVWNGSSVNAKETVFSGNKGNNAQISEVSLCVLSRADLTSAGEDGVRASRGSLLQVDGANMSNCFRHGLQATRSRISAVPTPDLRTRFNNNGENGILILDNSTFFGGDRAGDINEYNDNGAIGAEISKASTAALSFGQFNNCGTIAIQATQASVVDATQADISGGCSNSGIRVRSSYVTASGSTIANVSGKGIDAREASKVAFVGGSATTTGSDGLYCDASEMDAGESTVDGVTGFGILSFNNASVNATGADVRNTSSDAVRAFRMSSINLRGGFARKDPLTNSVNDIVVLEGGLVTSHGSTGGGLSQTKNSLTSDGIIFATP